MNRLTLVCISPGLIAGLLGLVTASTAPGQITDPLVTDRPDFTESAVAVQPGRIQLESGYTFSRENDVTTHAIGEVLARIGLVSRLELRLALNSFGFTDDASANQSGFEDFFVGAKIQVADAAPAFNLLKPGVALLVGTSIPMGQENFGGEGVWPELKLALEWDLSQRLSVASNLNAASIQVDDDRFGQFSGSLAAGYAIAVRWGAYLEYFGFASSKTRGLDENFLNGGLTLLANNDLQFDARVGIGLNDPDVNYFLGLGFSWRI
jgi:hypothetical protein